MTLPDPVAAQVGPALVARGVRVFDLSGTFRLRDPAQRRRWYPATPDLAEPAVYGLTEHYRAALPGARLIACPGCYPTAAVLALRPLVDAGLLEGDIVIDAKSGISGAGKTPSGRPTSRNVTAVSPPTASSSTGTAPRSSRSSSRP